ncbi:MAG: TetR/AcrR family transcriptional regulator [Candidatus Omnitrophica bacterium]|nr:TetR/AcrR family transcriptional regulator [Candidatus Omnitrophota bacterium]
MDRKERDKQLRKADILKAAESVFASKGYHEATIQDIAKEAQYGTGTVYLYFKDKSALYFSLLEEKIEDLAKTVQEKIEGIKDARKKLEGFIQESLIFFERNQSFFRIYMLEKSNLQLIVDKKASESFPSIEYITDYIGRLIKTAQKQDVIRKDCDASEIADVLASIMSSLILNWTKARSNKAGSLSDKADFICDMFLRGVGKK